MRVLVLTGGTIRVTVLLQPVLVATPACLRRQRLLFTVTKCAILWWQRLEELQEAMQEQEAQLQEALEVQGAVAAAQEQLVQRLEHCSRLQTNLHARVSRWRRSCALLGLLCCGNCHRRVMLLCKKGAASAASFVWCADGDLSKCLLPSVGGFRVFMRLLSGGSRAVHPLCLRPTCQEQA